MNRLSIGLVTGGGGGLLLILMSFIQVSYLPFIVPFLVGITIGLLVARNRSYAGKMGRAGALAGLLAGGLLVVGAIIATIITFNSPSTQRQLQIALTQQAATSTTANTTSTSIDVTTITKVTGAIAGCFIGLIYLGISTGMGSVIASVAGRKTLVSPIAPYGQYSVASPKAIPAQPMTPSPPPPIYYPLTLHETQPQSHPDREIFTQKLYAPLKIFISHSHLDNAFSKRLHEYLQQALPNANIFFDVKALAPGDPYIKVIQQAVIERPIFIVILSLQAVKSPWIQEEVNTALNKRLAGDTSRLIISVLYEPCDINQLAPFLRNYQMIDIPAKGESAGLAELVEALRNSPASRMS